MECAEEFFVQFKYAPADTFLHSKMFDSSLPECKNKGMKA